MSINVLPENVVKRIAAGEVIERPVSIVKELLENSLDAKSTRIEIRIENGGIDAITVIDNGVGISKSDITKLLKRHSTSKIESEDDLDSIATLGFRGEALYSVASVTKLRIKTRHANETEGTELISEDGQITISTVSAPRGTTIEAKALFHNTPARRKFLKSASSEFTRIADLVSRYVLAYPSISFELHNNGHVSLQSLGGGPEDPLIALWGTRITSEMIQVDYRSGNIRITGFVSSPVISRSSRKDITIFVNGRLVKDAGIMVAIENSYKNVLKGGRFPFAILKIEMPSSDVDVNVHPNKREVRFVDSQVIFRAVRGACEKALRMYQPFLKHGSGSEFQHTQSGASSPTQQQEISGELPAEIMFFDEINKEHPDEMMKIPRVMSLMQKGQVIEFLDTYLIFEDGDELAVVDFHNLHERIIFEEMEESHKSGKNHVISQKLMFPESFTLPPDLAQLVEDNLEFIEQMGFEVASFGAGAFIIRAVPHFLRDSSAGEALVDILRGTFDEGGNEVDFTRKFKISTACKSAIKAGKKLQPEEIQYLLQHVDDARYMNCPHGRPTIIKLDRSFFDSRFKRKSK